jgi:hypothetical protein
MLPEISLHILDIAENSVSAGASLVQITVSVDRHEDLLTVSIEDDGCGMTEEQLKKILSVSTDENCTIRSGIGLPLFKAAAEAASGHLAVNSVPGRGTEVKAVFVFSDKNRKPLGDTEGVIHDLIIFHPDTDFVYTYREDGKELRLDSREIKMLIADKIKVEEKMDEEHCRVTGDQRQTAGRDASSC